MFTATAVAFEGTPHCPATVKLRVAPATRAGPPYGPASTRVSKRRQGDTTKNDPPWRVSTSVAESFPGSGSTMPAGAAIVAVLERSPTAAAGTNAFTVKVAEPSRSRWTVVEMSPVPDCAPQADPALATHVQETPVSSPGIASATLAPTTGVGPALVATI